MLSTEHLYLPKREAIAFLVVATLTVTLLQNLFYQTPRPSLDALRYIDYALNIHDHDVFGLSGRGRDTAPAPGNANSPLYPMLVAFAVSLDPKLEASLRCAITSAPVIAVSCPDNYALIVGLQNALVIGALFCLWSTVMLLYRRSPIAWLAGTLALASTKPLFFANHLLTEILILFFFSLLMLALVCALKSGRRRWWLASGVIVGLMTLTRPEYLYLGYCFITIGVGLLVLRGWKRAGGALAVFILAFYGVVGPWLIRNHNHFDSVSITEGYSDTIIAYRSAYNRMSLPEWSAAFVYWLPGHGEALAAKLLPRSTYRKLGTDSASYLYLDGEEIFQHGLAAVNGERDRLTNYLIKTEILAHPFNHAFASIPLAWRGILAGKYLAVPGVPCLLILVVMALQRRDWGMLVLLVPAVIMVGLYAAVSVSIPRYNVYLIYYYAIAVAWVAINLIDRARGNPSTTTAATGRSARS